MAARDEGQRLIRRSGPRREVWVRAADEDWLLAAGLETADRPEQLRGARVLSRRGRGSSILVEGRRPLIAKTLRHGGALGSLLGERFLRPTRLERLRRITDRLVERGVDTPGMAFLRVHRRGPGCRLEVATDYWSDAVDLDAWLGTAPSPAELRRIARATGRTIAAMHAAGVQHADLNLRNLLVQGERVAIIDLEASELRDRACTEEERLDNWARLYRSLLKRGHAPGAAGATLGEEELAIALRAAVGRGWRSFAERVAQRHRSTAWRHPWTWTRGRAGLRER